MDTRELASLGKRAANRLLAIDAATKNRALGLVARRLEERSSEVFEANRADLEEAGRGGLPGPLLKRLRYDEAKLAESLAAVSAVRALPDPSGRILESRRLDEGLELTRVSCPIGLIAMIFESRPDALVQMAALAAKSGNAVVAKGGREARRTNAALAGIVGAAGIEGGLPAGWLSNIETREEVGALLALHDLVDLVIPRGSNEFVASIMRGSAIPVLGHANGVCHLYLHEDADPAMAASLAVDSKAQYPAACNAAEVLLVHASFAQRALVGVAAALQAAGVRLDACPRSHAILSAEPGRGISPELLSLKDDSDWSVEYLDFRMAVKVVDSLDEAVEHVNRHGSRHTDAIVAASAEAARRFMDGVDTASAYWNASTRFADGFRYGLGAEVGISTGKLHARGPVGLEGLATYKWRLVGAGHRVEDYASGARRFLHELPGAGAEGRDGD